MRYSLFERHRDGFILIARLLLTMLFVMSGWGKLTHFDATVGYMASQGAPLPGVAAAVAVCVELLVSAALILGFYTRPLALLFALFVAGTAVIGHHYWTLTDPERSMNVTQFYKNMSIIGGFLLLSVTGAGRYSLGRR